MPQAFKHFLETVQQDEAGVSADSTQVQSDNRGMEVLRTLDTEQAIPVDHLRAKSGLDFTEFAETVKTFMDAGLIDMQGQPGDEVVKLTDQGKSLVSLKL